MIPWYHYIPVEFDMKDTVYLIDFFERYPDIAKRIANNGHEFIKNNLDFEAIRCYWRDLLLEYSKLLNYQIPEKPKNSIVIGSRKEEL